MARGMIPYDPTLDPVTAEELELWQQSQREPYEPGAWGSQLARDVVGAVVPRVGDTEDQNMYRALGASLGIMGSSGPGTPGMLAALRKPYRLTGPLKAEGEYLYHATNSDNLEGIAKSGLRPHRPNYGTEQTVWPDGKTENRAYFGTAENIWQFAPEHGMPVALRVKKDAARFLRESTGDMYTQDVVPPHLIEYLDESGAWKPLAALKRPK